MFELHRLTVDDGVALALHIAEASRAGPVLLFTHANGFSALSYAPLLAELSKSMAVVAMDLRCHGLSTQVNAQAPRLSRLSDDYVHVLSWIRSTYPNRPLVGAGHSIGALLPLLSAAPPSTSLSALALIEAAVFPPQDHPSRAEAEALTADRVANIPRRRSVFVSPVALAQALERLPAFSGVEPAHLMQHCESVLLPRDDGLFELRCPPSIEAFLYSEVAQFDDYNSLKAIAGPTLLIGGDPTYPGSSWVTRSQVLLREAIKPSRLEVIPKSGHLLPLQRPYVVAQLIEQWIPR